MPFPKCFRSSPVLGLIFLLAACATSPAQTPPVTVLPWGAATSPRTSTPAPTATPAPVTLTVCQKGEPTSLYLYGDDAPARAGIFDALFDGPIDSAGYAYQAVILQSLPSLENGGAEVDEMEVRPGDKVVDAVTGGVVPLAEGVHLAQKDGSQVAYSGSEPARTVQVTARFSLKPGLLWSDGQPLTADDSLFSFEVASSPDTPASKYILDRTARYEKVDDLSTRWTGLPGWADANFFLRFWTPLPRHLDGQLTPAEMLTHEATVQRPLGWGPFRFGEWVKGDHLTLVRNPNYFRASEGLPRVEQVTFRFGLDGDKILAELAAGRCDIGDEEADFSGQVQALLQARADGSLAPQFVTGTSFEHLDFDIQPAPSYSRAAGSDVFQDVRVRRAIADCLDRRALVDQLLSGLSEVPAVYLPSAHPLYAADRVTLYPFDPAQGQALLAEAGWVDNDGDGIREKGRRKLTLDYASGPEGDAFRQALMQFVQSQLLTNCGIEVQIRLYSLQDLTDVWPKGVLFGRKFDLGEFAWQTGVEPPCGLYLTSAIPSDQNPGGENDTAYSSPAFDQACLTALNTLDPATRQAQHAEAQAIFTQDLPSLPLFWRVKIGVALPRVTGYRLDPTAASDLWNIEQIGLAGR